MSNAVMGRPRKLTTGSNSSVYLLDHVWDYIDRAREKMKLSRSAFLSELVVAHGGLNCADGIENKKQITEKDITKVAIELGYEEITEAEKVEIMKQFESLGTFPDNPRVIIEELISRLLIKNAD